MPDPHATFRNKNSEFCMNRWMVKRHLMPQSVSGVGYRLKATRIKTVEPTSVLLALDRLSCPFEPVPNPVTTSFLPVRESTHAKGPRAYRIALEDLSKSRSQEN